MIQLPHFFTRPKHPPADLAALEASFRRDAAFPRLLNTPPDPLRESRLIEAALRHIRQARAEEPGFAWLFQPRLAAGFAAILLAGWFSGAVLIPAPQPAGESALAAVLDAPFSSDTGAGP
jgi:AcrR family transcriptional regulator